MPGSRSGSSHVSLLLLAGLPVAHLQQRARKASYFFTYFFKSFGPTSAP
jgi:hypothetical protein